MDQAFEGASSAMAPLLKARVPISAFRLFLRKLLRDNDMVTPSERQAMLKQQGNLTPDLLLWFWYGRLE
tara:strand:- start:1103 stop:1309 length:207 start_codon:yes stop_codon:yes gene_type:complete